jgi:sugar phosphate isomerase/epimerase
VKWVLNTYETAQEWEVERIIAVCQNTGYAGIEFLQDFKQPHGLEATAPDAHLLAVKQKMQAAGLITASLTSCCNFHAPAEADRRRSVEQCKQVIDEAALMGCDHVRVLGDRVPDDDEEAREAILENVAAALQELGDHAAPRGITVSIEAHSSFTDPLLVTRVVKEANRPNVGIVFNSQWRTGAKSGWNLPTDAPSIAPLYDLIAPYITSIHTHEMEKPDVWSYYREFFRLLVRDGYNGYVSNECAYRGSDPDKVLRLYTALFHTLIDQA